jgi:DNA-binding response OmpR family regulator
MERTVLIVDDHARIVEILRDYLEADGFMVRTAADGAAALDILAREAVDCVVLDIMLPGADGFAVCRQIRASSDVPVLFLSARGAESDKLRGLGLGDDYIVKNASPAEIVARVKTVLKRAERGAHGRYGPGTGYRPTDHAGAWRRSYGQQWLSWRRHIDGDASGRSERASGGWRGPGAVAVTLCQSEPRAQRPWRPVSLSCKRERTDGCTPVGLSIYC